MTDITSTSTHPPRTDDRRDTAAPDGAAADAVELTVTEAAEVSLARHWASTHARRLGYAADRVGDLELVVTELATNALCHGAGPARITLHTEAGRLVCSVHDTGRWQAPSSSGPSTPTAPGGRGLLLVRGLCEHVDTRADATGTTVRAVLGPTG